MAQMCCDAIILATYSIILTLGHPSHWAQHAIPFLATSEWVITKFILCTAHYSCYLPLKVHESFSKVPGHTGWGPLVQRLEILHHKMFLAYASLMSYSKSRQMGSQGIISASVTSFHSPREVFLWKSNLTLCFKVKRSWNFFFFYFRVFGIFRGEGEFTAMLTANLKDCSLCWYKYKIYKHLKMNKN